MYISAVTIYIKMLNEQLLPIFLMLYHQTIMTTVTGILGILYIVPVYFLGFRIYNIYTSNTKNLLLSKIKWSTKLDEDNKPIGYFISNNCIGYYNERENILKCICTETYFKQITKKPSVNIDKTEKKEEFISVYNKNNRIEYVYYKQILFNVFYFSPLPNQEKAIEQISNQYEKSIHKSVVCLLHGKPNTGKSMISILMAKKLKAHYCKTYKPIDAGDSFDTIYNTCNPSEMNPLVILLDEFDIILEKITSKNIKINEKVLTEVTDKTSWNTLFDNFSIGLYPYTIIILTTNETPAQIIKKYDPSCIRENRCHLMIEMK